MVSSFILFAKRFPQKGVKYVQNIHSKSSKVKRCNIQVTLSSYKHEENMPKPLHNWPVVLISFFLLFIFFFCLLLV